MLTDLAWLALEVKYLDAARPFYEGTLGLPVVRRSDDEVVYAAGGDELVLRAPSGVPRGGLHTHYAFSTPASEYDDWWSRLEREFELVEHTFGEARSLYLYDPDGNCVEIGQSSEPGTGLTGIFEIVLEVEELERSLAFYETLGGDVVDRGSGRTRVRLDVGPVDVELWEPHLGLADARGGVHVDVGFRSPSPESVIAAVEGMACRVEPLDGGARIRDPDGHYITVHGE